MIDIYLAFQVVAVQSCQDVQEGMVVWDLQVPYCLVDNHQAVRGGLAAMEEGEPSLEAEAVRPS